MAEGEPNPMIARNLLSVSIVKDHVQHVIAKLGVSDCAQDAVRAMELGLANGFPVVRLSQRNSHPTDSRLAI